MKTKEKRCFLTGIPSWSQALLTAVLSMVILFVFASLLNGIPKLNDNGELIAYIIYDVVIATACFFICKKNPRSIWYVPVISNTMGIIAAIAETNFWITDMWIVVCSGWLLSLIAAIIGALNARQGIENI